MCVNAIIVSFISCSVTKSLENFFRGRSAVSILNWAGFSAASNVSDQLASLVAPSPSPSSAPILHLQAGMSPGCFLALQFLQSSPATSVKSTEPSATLTESSVPWKLSTVHAQKSLLTVYTGAVSTDVLVLTSSEMQEGQHQQGEGAQQGEEGEGAKDKHLKAQSIKILAELKLPVVQVNFSALVESEVSADSLPGLVPGQQQLDFSLTAPTAARIAVCDLLEAGIKEAKMSLAAHIVHTETSQSPVLTWDSLQGAASQDAPSLESSENEAVQRVYASLSMPVLWCQLASPPCGLPHPAAGGLDILLLCDAIQVWQEPILALKESVVALLSTKTCRDKQVLLTLLTNAFQNPPLLLDKPGTPVLAELSVQYRNTAVFSCLHQVWRALPIFSEIHVPPLSHCSAEEKSHSHNQLLAVLLALSSHLYTMWGVKVAPVHSRPNSPLIGREADRCSTGYVSISPSPSDLAMPNRLYDANRQYWEEEEAGLTVFSHTDHETLTVLREALVPLFSAFGLPVDHQLQVAQLNTAQFVIDFSVELRDATVFVLDHVSSPSIPPSLSTTPTVLAEQLLIHGCVKHNSEMVTALPQGRPSLLLPTPSDVPVDSSKARLLSNCSVSMETIHATVTAPLLKLAKHVNVTGRLRRKAWKQAQLDQVDAMETPRPHSSAPPTVEADSDAGAVYVTKFASSMVAQLSGFHEVTNNGMLSPASNTEQQTSHIKVVEFHESPQPYRVTFTSASPALATRAESLQQQPVPPVATRYMHSSTYSSSDLEHSQSISVHATEGTSPEDLVSTMDTCGEDTTGTDSQHLVSSDNDKLASSQPASRRPSTAGHASAGHTSVLAPPANQFECSEHTQSLLQGLSLPDSELQFSVFVLVRLNSARVMLQVETTKAVLELANISAAVDARNVMPTLTVSTGLPLLSDILPTYLSVAATLRKTLVHVSDKGLPENDIIQLSVLPVYASVAISNRPPILPNYRCLLKLTQPQMDIKQSAVKVHKRFQELMPAFTMIYHDIFGHATEVIPDTAFSTPSTSDEQVLRMESVIKLPVKLPQGFIHLSLDKAGVYVAPLPSLNVTYTVCKPHPLTNTT